MSEDIISGDEIFSVSYKVCVFIDLASFSSMVPYGAKDAGEVRKCSPRASVSLPVKISAASRFHFSRFIDSFIATSSCSPVRFLVVMFCSQRPAFVMN
jgi:hypothetical protein